MQCTIPLGGADHDTADHRRGAEHAEQDPESGTEGYLSHPGVVQDKCGSLGALGMTEVSGDGQATGMRRSTRG